MSKKKPKITRDIRLVKSPLAKNCCKDRSEGQPICGSVYQETTKKGRKIVSNKCYPAGHDLQSGK